MAVTDFPGLSRQLSVTYSPRMRWVSRAPQMAGWRDRGRSPYPGLNRSVRKRPGRRAETSPSAASQPASTQALPQPSSRTAFAMSRAWAARSLASKTAPRVQASRAAWVHSRSMSSAVRPGRSRFSSGRYGPSGVCSSSNSRHRHRGVTAAVSPAATSSISRRSASGGGDGTPA